MFSASRRVNNLISRLSPFALFSLVPSSAYPLNINVGIFTFLLVQIKLFAYLPRLRRGKS